MMKKPWRYPFLILLITSLLATGCDSTSLQFTSQDEFNPMKIEAESCTYGGEIKSVEAVDQYTVKFTLCKADAVFAEKMTSPILVIQDKEFLDSHHGSSNIMTYQTNGTGPYNVVRYSSTAPIHLRTSSNYWGTPPRLSDIYFNGISEDDLVDPEALLQKGDVFNTSGVSKLKTILDESPDFTAVDHASMNVVYIGFNNTIAPMNDVTMRKVIATALDTTKLATIYLPEGSEVATQLIPSTVSPGRTKKLQWYDYRSENAKTMLDSINFNYNQIITLAFVNSGSSSIPSPRALAAEIQRELGEIGMKVVLKPMSQTDFDNAMEGGTEMMFIDTIEALYNDGAAFYEIPLLRETKRFGDPYSNLQIEFQKTLSYSSETVRQEMFDVLNADFKDAIPLIPIGHTSNTSYFKNTLNSYGINSWFENYEEMYNLSRTLQIYDENHPDSLWPVDETDYDTFRITRLMYDTLVTEGYGTTGLISSLADTWESNTDLTEWTFYLRYEVKFSDESELDANDVVASFAALWDASSTNHIGNSGDYEFFKLLFGNLLNEIK